MKIPDRRLADIAARIGGNIIEMSHQCLFAAASVQGAELKVIYRLRA